MHRLYQPMTCRFRHNLLCAAIAVISAACGHHHDHDSTTPPTAPARGSLLVTPPQKVSSLAPGDLLALLTGSDLSAEFAALAFTPECTVNVYRIQYQTADPANALTGGSGALMVPSGTGADCTGARPIVEYAHGTNADKNFDLSMVATTNSESLLLAVAFASQGYIVVAPNYVGYDTSALGYHPYLIADQQSNDMIDALAAARSALPTADESGTTASSKLFLTGYSQGGYVALATQRAMENAGMSVTASAPLSGPYALGAFGDAIFEGQVNTSAVVNIALIVNAYQHAYGDVYAAASDVYEDPYASGIDSLLPSISTVADLVSQNKLPDQAVFDPVPPDAAYAAYTPATAPAQFAAIFARGFGNPHLIKNSFRKAYLDDAAAAPDGGFPSLTTGLPATGASNALRKDLIKNDLRGGWSAAAKTPTLLCGGSSDPTVFYFNTTLIQSFLANAGAADLTVVDIDSSGAPYADLKAGFQVAKDTLSVSAAARGDDPELAVLDAYHTTLVAPFCVATVKQFFDAH